MQMNLHICQINIVGICGTHATKLLLISLRATNAHSSGEGNISSWLWFFDSRITERAVEPLNAQLTDLDQAINDQLDLIGATKANIIHNDERIEKMLRSVGKSWGRFCWNIVTNIVIYYTVSIAQTTQSISGPRSVEDTGDQEWQNYSIQL